MRKFTGAFYIGWAIIQLAMLWYLASGIIMYYTNHPDSFSRIQTFWLLFLFNVLFHSFEDNVPKE